MPLSQEEIEACRDAFMVFDKDRSGSIDVWELRLVLETMGQKPTEEELFQMVSEVDDNKSGTIGEPCRTPVFSSPLFPHLCFPLACAHEPS